MHLEVIVWSCERKLRSCLVSAFGIEPAGREDDGRSQYCRFRVLIRRRHFENRYENRRHSKNVFESGQMQY